MKHTLVSAQPRGRIRPELREDSVVKRSQLQEGSYNLGGKVFLCSNNQIVMMISLFVTGISVIATPVCHRIWVAYMIAVAGGAAISLFEIGNEMGIPKHGGRSVSLFNSALLIIFPEMNAQLSVESMVTI